jgi:hypothetical protein
MQTQRAPQADISSNHDNIFQESNEDTNLKYQQQEHPTPSTLSPFKNSDENEELVKDTQNCSEQNFDQLLSNMSTDENTSAFEDNVLPNLFVEAPREEVEPDSTIAASSVQPLNINPMERRVLRLQLTQVRGVQRQNRMRRILPKRCKDENCPFRQHIRNPTLQKFSTQCPCGKAFQFFQNNSWISSSSLKNRSDLF